MSRFASANAFEEFKKEVTRRTRYLRSPNGERFLRAVAETSKRRLRVIPDGAVFWRAQVGHEWIVDVRAGTRTPGPHSKTRMKPLEDRAYEGRVNPKGIPCLYFATTKEVAMSEVRPWIGSVVTVGRFETVREQRLVDCSVFHGDEIPSMAATSAEDVEQVVWAHIDHAFARPVTRSDNVADYAATQVLAEVFRLEGYDGIIYRSAFSAEGTNVALFDLNCAHQLDSSIFTVRRATYEFGEVEPIS
jgi:RES domain-containing protein